MPAARADKSSVVAVNDEGPVQANVFEPAPPVTDKLIAPVDNPLHVTFVTIEVAANAAFGARMVTVLRERTQLLASLTFTLYVPAARPVNEALET